MGGISATPLVWRSRVPELAWPGLCSAIVFALFLAAEWQGLWMSGLINDDGWWVGMPMSGRLQRPEGYELFHYVVYWVCQLQSLPLLRLVLVTAHALAAGVMCHVLRREGVDTVLAAAASVAIATLPWFSLQHVFVSASHQVFATPFALAGLLAISSAARSIGERKWLLFLAGVGLSLLATRFSPIYTLFSIVPLIAWVLLDPRSLQNRPTLIAFVLSFVVVTVDLTRKLLLKPHVYAGLEGWTDMSISRPFIALGKALSLLQSNTAAGGKVALAAYVIALGLGLIVLVRGLLEIRSIATEAQPRTVHPHHVTRMLRLSAVFVMAAAMAFAPAAFLTFYLDRYSFVPGVFCGTAAALFLAYFPRSTTGRRALSAALICVTIGNAVSLQALQSRRTAAVKSTAERIQAVIDQEKDGWKPQSQVVFFLRKGEADEFVGYVHFSTGALRYWAKRDDVVGLIGGGGTTLPDPLVEKPNEFGVGDQYWRVIGGMYRRLSMVGLHRGRALYVYAADSDGSYALASSAIMKHNDKVISVRAGESPETAISDPQWSGCIPRESHVFVWPNITPMPPEC